MEEKKKRRENTQEAFDSQDVFLCELSGVVL